VLYKSSLADEDKRPWLALDGKRIPPSDRPPGPHKILGEPPIKRGSCRGPTGSLTHPSNLAGPQTRHGAVAKIEREHSIGAGADAGERIDRECCSSIKGQDQSREPNPEQRRRWKKFSLSEQKIHRPRRRYLVEGDA